MLFSIMKQSQRNLYTNSAYLIGKILNAYHACHFYDLIFCITKNNKYLTIAVFAKVKKILYKYNIENMVICHT